MAVLTERQSCNKTQSLSWDAQPKEDLFGILHHFIASRVIQDPERFTPAVRRVWIRFTDKGVTRRPRSLVFTARALGLFMTQSAEPMQLRRHDIDSHFDAALAVDSSRQSCLGNMTFVDSFPESHPSDLNFAQCRSTARPTARQAGLTSAMPVTGNDRHMIA